MNKRYWCNTLHFVEVNGIGEYNPLRDNETNGFIKAVIPAQY